jgi:hypothetical protein
MAQWGSTDAAANSPFMTVQQLKKKANVANRDALYGNTTTTAGVFAVDAAEQAASDSPAAHSGWVLRTLGTGPVTSVTITDGGTGYANTDTFEVTASSGGVAATGTITTDGSGVITDVALTSTGSGYTTKAPAVVITTSAGTGATLAAVAGGRAGRVMQEVLAAIDITTDGTDDTIYPDA